MIVVVTAALVTMGCTRDPAHAPAATIDVTALDGSAGAVVATSDDAGAPVVPASGEYEVTEKVLADDCRPEFKALEPWRATVQASASAEKGEARVNIPLIGIPPLGARSGRDRMDVWIAPRRVAKAQVVPLAQCFSYVVTRSVEITEASARGFTVMVTVEHGDSMKCSSIQPAHCTTRVEQRYAR